MKLLCKQELRIYYKLTTCGQILVVGPHLDCGCKEGNILTRTHTSSRKEGGGGRGGEIVFIYMGRVLNTKSCQFVYKAHPEEDIYGLLCQ